MTTLGDVSRAQLDPDRRHRRLRQRAARGAARAARSTSPCTRSRTCRPAPPQGIALAAVPPRDDPRDALVARDGAKLADLPPGARIGTGSPRRAAQLRALRGDISCVPIRGNAGTRLAQGDRRRARRGGARLRGLARIGRADAVTQVFEPDEMLPAPARARWPWSAAADDPGLAALLAAVSDDGQPGPPRSPSAALLAALEAGCSAPVGAIRGGHRAAA